jgi:pimeloyl-ACP methyl ester carboxylesterase
MLTSAWLIAAWPASGAALAQSPTPSFQGYAALPGVDLWYTDTGGNGVPIMLLHAASGSTEMWQHNAESFAAAGYRAIAFDRRGWGRTHPHEETGPPSGTAAGDLDALADYLGIGRFHLIGTAAGGSVAYDYALWRPERLLSLTVIASGAGGLGDPGLAATRARVELPDFREWPVHYRELSQGYMARDPEGTARWIEINSRARHEEILQQSARTPLTAAALETITVPTLLLAGEADVSNPPWVIRIQAKHVPGAEFHLISEAGHSINWEQPEVFNRVVLDFISRH